MSKFLIAIHHPDTYDPRSEDPTMTYRISRLNRQMEAAGIRVFVGGLHPANHAKSVRWAPDGKIITTDGPYLHTHQHVGGFWVVETSDLSEALMWGRKVAKACLAPVEVRQFHDYLTEPVCDAPGQINDQN
ncbi:MAG: YciI family protein [Opitutus sp.]